MSSRRASSRHQAAAPASTLPETAPVDARPSKKGAKAATGPSEPEASVPASKDAMALDPPVAEAAAPAATAADAASAAPSTSSHVPAPPEPPARASRTRAASGAGAIKHPLPDEPAPAVAEGSKNKRRKVAHVKEEAAEPVIEAVEAVSEAAPVVEQPSQAAAEAGPSTAVVPAPKQPKGKSKGKGKAVAAKGKGKARASVAPVDEGTTEVPDSAVETTQEEAAAPEVAPTTSVETTVEPAPLEAVAPEPAKMEEDGLDQVAPLPDAAPAAPAPAAPAAKKASKGKRVSAGGIAAELANLGDAAGQAPAAGGRTRHRSSFGTAAAPTPNGAVVASTSAAVAPAPKATKGKGKGKAAASALPTPRAPARPMPWLAPGLTLRPRYTHPVQVPKKAVFDNSLPNLLNSWIAPIEEDAPDLAPDTPLEVFAQRAEYEADILIRKQDLLDRGKTLFNPDRTVAAELKREKDHHDTMVEHAIYFSSLVDKERKFHIAQAKRLARMVVAHFKKLETKDEMKDKNQIKEQKALARFVSREIRKKWKMATTVVKALRKERLAQERERLGKLQLSEMLDKSETMLQAQQQEMVAERSGSEDEGSSDGEEDEESDEDEEEEEEEEEEEDGAENGDESMQDSARDDSQTPLPSDLPPTEPASEEPEPVASSSAPVEAHPEDQDDGDEFNGPHDEKEAQEDDQFQAEMELEEATAGPDDAGEDAGLLDDMNVPIEELLRRAGYEGYLDARAEEEGMELEEQEEDGATPAPTVGTDEADDEAEAAAASEFGGSDADDEKLEKEDEDLEDAMEQEEAAAAEEDDGELAGLEDDAKLSVEELRRKYYGDAGEEASEATAEDAAMQEASDDEKETSPTTLAEDGEDDKAEQVEQDEDEEPAADAEDEDEELAVAKIKKPATLRPPFLLRGSLRPYQQAGLEWLASLYSNGVNGILADEMGLGKTIQTISLLAHLACDRGQWGPHLIVVPTSVMLNWEMEFKKFLPGFKTISYYGSQKERKEKRKGWNSENSFNVVITSYQLCLADQHIIRRKPWHYLILDEAHHIKNFRSQRWQVLLGFNAKNRLLLTGTPLQNNLMELWSLLYFLMPHGMSGSGKGPFAGHATFQAWFSNPMEKAIETEEEMDEETRKTVNKLHTILRPYLLRRLKAEVETQMPGKTEQVIYCRMSKRQRFLYDDFMSRSATRDTLSSGNFLSIMNTLMQLRKVCNHPDLFEERPILTSFAMPRSVVSDYEITELLVRRRLVADEETGTQVDWSNLTLIRPDEATASRNSVAAVRRLDGTLAIRSLYQPSLNLYEEPIKDTKSIAGWRSRHAWKQELDLGTRWASTQLMNRRRCALRGPFYGAELLARLRQPARESPLLLGRAPDLDVPLSMSSIQLVKPYAQRAADMKEVISRFAFVTPKVTALDLATHALPGVTAEQLRAHEAESKMDTSMFSQPSVKLAIAFPDRSLLQYDCGKLQKLDELLRECKAGGHRALIFTQMTKVLDILEIFLSFHGHRYLRLDGSTKIENRQRMTERYNTDERILCFISSTRSGGLGINLQGADTVIFYDSDWNPALDRQCQDRAHRIGQTRTVRIWRFVTEHSIEENMLRKANQKRRLDDMVIAEGSFTTDYLAKLDWRDYLDDGQLNELGVSTAEGGVESAADVSRALAAVEDEEDAAAAKAAEGELALDQSDFNETAPIPPSGSGSATPLQQQQKDGSATPVLPSTEGATPVPQQPPEDEGPEDPLKGTIDGYMVAYVDSNWEQFA